MTSNEQIYLPVTIKGDRVSNFGNYETRLLFIAERAKNVKMLAPYSGRDLTQMAYSMELRAPDGKFIPVLYSPSKENDIIVIDSNGQYDINTLDKIKEKFEIIDKYNVDKNFTKLKTFCDYVAKTQKCQYGDQVKKNSVTQGIILGEVLIEIIRTFD